MTIELYRAVATPENRTMAERMCLSYLVDCQVIPTARQREPVTPFCTCSSCDGFVVSLVSGNSPQAGLMSELVRLGELISELRKRRGLTQEDLAGRPEMDRSYLSEI